MENAEKSEKPDALAQARKVLGLPYLEDKAVCFVSSWERTKVSTFMPAEEDEKEYGFQEMSLFETALRWWQKNGEFEFFAFREFQDLIEWDDIDFKEIENVKRKFPLPKPKVDSTLGASSKEKFIYELNLSDFLSRHSVAHIKYQQKTDDLIGHHVTILPVNEIGSAYVKALQEDKDKGLPELYHINILCINYRHFPYFIISHFLKYMSMLHNKEKIEVQAELKPLYQFFRKTSPDVKMITYIWLTIWIDKAYNNALKVEDWDKIEFLSMNHLQNSTTPFAWSDVKDPGYVCTNNINTVKIEPSNERTDCKFFYSFESLLLFELRNCLKRIRRCENCHAIIGTENIKYKGKYCSKESKNYRKCYAERNRKRQIKHYNLTKA